MTEMQQFSHSPASNGRPLPISADALTTFDFGWLVAAFTLTAFVLNEAVGSIVIYASILLWALLAAAKPVRLLKAALGSGVIIWMLPTFALISVGWSIQPGHTLRMGLELVLTTLIGVFCANLASPRRMITTIIIASGMALLPSFFVQNTHHDGLTGISSWAGIFQNKNTLGAVSCVFCLACLATALDDKQGNRTRAAALFGAALGAGVCFFARSVANWTALFAACACLSVIASARIIQPRLRSAYVLSVSLAGVITALAGFVLFSTFSDELLALVNKDPTLTGRTKLWFWADRLSDDQPWLGVGYQAFWVVGHSPAEYLWDIMRIPTKMGFHFHSLYYELLIGLGYIGVVFAAVTVAAVAANTFLWTKTEPGPTTAFYFSFLVYILLIQIQGVNLFGIFEPWYTLFVITYVYAAGGHRRTVVPRLA